MGRFLLFKVIGVLSVISIQVVVAAEENGKPGAINQVAAKNQTSNKNANFKCNEVAHVKFDDATTCPSEGKFVWISDDIIDCDLYVSCKCQGGRMTALVDSCEANETFTAEKCVNNTDISNEMRCPQQKCKPTEILKPTNHSHLHNCPKVVLEDYPGDEHHGHDHHDHEDHHDHHESTTKPSHGLSSTIVPFFHSIILMLVASLAL